MKLGLLIPLISRYAEHAQDGSTQLKAIKSCTRCPIRGGFRVS
jgi:hypothetical protein